MKNKIKTLAAIIVMVVTLTAMGCKKEKNQPGNNSSNTPTTGTVYFLNNELNPYSIYLDGTCIGILSANKVSPKGYTITSGIGHGVRAEQYNGYIVYPTIYTGTATVNPGGTITWSF